MFRRFLPVAPRLAVPHMAALRCATDDAASGAKAVLAVATDVTALKKKHQTAAGDERKKIERDAWAKLNSLSEDQIAVADGRGVALTLNAWAHFSKYWEKGQDGPLEK